MQTEALSGSSKVPTYSEDINVFGEKNDPSSQRSKVKMHIGLCDWCKEWDDLVHTRNFFGDDVKVCRNCLNNPAGPNKGAN